MDVKAENLLLENLLTKGQFIIPDYQREYDWDDTEIDEFLDDLNDLEKDEKYFIGHMVFEGDFNGTKFSVIDGQQRITTTTILLCVVRDLLIQINSIPSIKLAEAIHNKYVFNKDKNGEDFEVLRNDMPYPILQAYVQSKFNEKDKRVKPHKSGEKKIIKAYDKFLKIFNSLNQAALVEYRDKLLNLEVIFVAVKESEDNEKVDAHEIFMTLNATGKDLTPLDLIKSRVFKTYSSPVNIKEPADSWKEMINNIGDNKKFLNNFWASRYKKVADKKIFKEFVKEIIKKKADIKVFMQDLLNDSEIFRMINSPLKDNWKEPGEIKIYYSLNAITRVFSVEVANSILISLIREYKSREISLVYFQKALNAIERFHFINNAINSNRSSGLDTMYSKIARDLKEAKGKHKKHKVIDEMIEKIKGKTPSKSEFDSNFDERLFFTSKRNKQKLLVQYVLKKLEFKKNPNADLVDISIEHIYPENPPAGTTLLKSELVENIGNLVLLDQKLNGDKSIGNKKFEQKKPIILEESHIITTKKVFQDNNTWGEIQINARRNSLVDELYENIWK